MRKISFIILYLSHFWGRYIHKFFLSNRIFKKFLRDDSYPSALAMGFPEKRKKSLFPGVKFLGLVIIAVLIILGGKVMLVDFHRVIVSQGMIGIYTQDNLPPIVANLLSDPLVILDKSGQPQPQLASLWQVNDSANLYTFKLRSNLFWNDGTEVLAGDIKFNIPDVEISYPDNSTIEFKLADSFNPFPTFLTAPVFKNDGLTGVGRYKVVEWKMSKGFITKLVLAPQDTQDKSLPAIVIRFYPDEKTARTAFELGEIDALVGVGENGNLLQNQSLVKEKRITTFNKLVAVFYNTKDAILSDKNFRRALSFATPQIEGEERAKTSISPFSWAYNGDTKDYLDNQEMAKTYLDKVSMGKGDIITLTTTPMLSAVGEEIVQSWKELGIPAALSVESGVPQNFQALLIQEPIPVDPDQYTLWHSTQEKTNLSKYSSARVDKDLEDGRKIGDLEKRKEKYLDFQKVLLDDAPATFLYFPKLKVIYRQKIEESLNKVLALQIPQF